MKEGFKTAHACRGNRARIARHQAAARSVGVGPCPHAMVRGPATAAWEFARDEWLTGDEGKGYVLHLCDKSVLSVGFLGWAR